MKHRLLGLLSLGIGLGLALGLAELAFRVGMLALPLTFKDPALYANPHNDDLYWLLHRQFQDGEVTQHFPETKQRQPVSADQPPPNNFVFDPEIGYAYIKDPEYNPSGDIRPDDKAPVKAPPVIVTGDSFVACMEIPVKDSITENLHRLMPEYEFLNFGVPGYGLGQIYLMTLRAAAELPRAPVLLVVFDDDIDRMRLSYRGSPKPAFSLDRHGALAIQPPREAAHYRSLMPTFFSLRALKHAILPNDYPGEMDIKRPLVDAIIASLHERLGDRLWGILLLSYGHHLNADLVGDAAERRGIPVLNLTQEMMDKGLYDDYHTYFTPTNHLSARGSTEVARLIRAFILSESRP